MGQRGGIGEESSREEKSGIKVMKTYAFVTWGVEIPKLNGNLVVVAWVSVADTVGEGHNAAGTLLEVRESAVDDSCVCAIGEDCGHELAGTEWSVSQELLWMGNGLLGSIEMRCVSL
jgi:hypothetical protein